MGISQRSMPGRTTRARVVKKEVTIVKKEVLSDDDNMPLGSLLKQPVPEFEQEDPEEECSVCFDGGDLLICDGCEQNFHLRCAVPPLKTIPADDWFCASCRRASPSGATPSAATLPKTEQVRQTMKKKAKREKTASKRVAAVSKPKTEPKHEPITQVGQLCEYELERAEAIRRNKQVLADLGVETALASASMGAEKRKPPTRGVKRSAPKPPAAPSRQSSRQRGTAAEELYISRESKGAIELGGLPSGMSKITFESNPQIVVRERDTRLPEETLTLESSAGTEESGTQFLNSLRQLVDKEQDTPAVSKKSMEYASRMAALTVEEASVCKVVLQRVYGLAVHPSPHAIVVAAGDKEGNLGLWNMDNSGEEDDGVVNYRPHTSPLNGLQWHPTEQSRLYSTGYDGTGRCLDANKGVLDFVYGIDSSRDTWLQCSDIGSGWAAETLAVGDSSGLGQAVDLRTGTASWSHQLHDKKINSMHFHPSQPYLLTGSLDRSTRVWDVRKMSKNPVVTMIDSRSVNNACWSPTGVGMVSVVQANYLRVWHNCHQLNGEVEPENHPSARNVRHDNQTGRYLSVFHARWDPKEDHSFVVGSMCKPRQVEVYSCDWANPKPKCHRVMSLQSDWIGSVQSRNAFHPTRDVLVCANASGRVHVFKEPS